MATFGELRSRIMRETGTQSYLAFRALSTEHDSFWEDINKAEFQRGYKRGEYEAPGTEALCNMDLLTEEELGRWIHRLHALSTKERSPT